MFAGKPQPSRSKASIYGYPLPPELGCTLGAVTLLQGKRSFVLEHLQLSLLCHWHFSHDGTDYEQMPVGMNFYIIEGDGSVTHTVDGAGIVISFNWSDFYLVGTSSSASRTYVGSGGKKKSETLLFGEYGAYPLNPAGFQPVVTTCSFFLDLCEGVGRAVGGEEGAAKGKAIGGAIEAHAKSIFSYLIACMKARRLNPRPNPEVRIITNRKRPAIDYDRENKKEKINVDGYTFDSYGYKILQFVKFLYIIDGKEYEIDMYDGNSRSGEGCNNWRVDRDKPIGSGSQPERAAIGNPFDDPGASTSGASGLPSQVKDTIKGSKFKKRFRDKEDGKDGKSSRMSLTIKYVWRFRSYYIPDTCKGGTFCVENADWVLKWERTLENLYYKCRYVHIR